MGSVLNTPCRCEYGCGPCGTSRDKPIRNISRRDITQRAQEDELPDELPDKLPTIDPILSMDRKTLELLLNFDGALLPETEQIQPIMRNIQTPPKFDEPTSVEMFQQQSNTRLSQIANISNIEQLEDTIRSNYGIIDTDDSEMSECSHTPSVNEKHNETPQQIQISTDDGPKKGLLFSAEDHEWGSEEIDGLRHEMQEQIEVLTKQATPVEINQLNKSGRLSQVLTVPPMHELLDANDLPASNLYRDESQDHWQNTEIKKTGEEMAKEMVHLLQLQTKSSTPVP